MPNDNTNKNDNEKGFGPLITALASIGAILTSGTLMWIGSSQLQLTTDMALTQQQVAQLQDSVERYFNEQETQLNRMIDNQNRIWPRLRAHGENIEILRREMETITGKDIKLVEPDKF